MPWTFPVGSMIGDSRALVLRVHLPNLGSTKTLTFDAQMTVAKACEHIRTQLREFELTGSAKDHGLFLPHEDNKKGLWLDNARTLEYYILRNGDTVEYRYRYRWLYIRTMDGTRKKLLVDDSQSVTELMRMICAKMGIYNHDEYSLIREHDEHDKEPRPGHTLRRSAGLGTGTLGRDQDKMEKLRRKLHTDDDMDWLNPSQSLRQQGIDENEILLLKRRYFFSDMNVDARDPVQLNLLYVQLKDAILKGTHPVSLDEAVQLAAIQCQVQFGDYSPQRIRSNFLDLKDCLPKEYAKLRHVEKKVFEQHAELVGLSEVDAKVKYCQFCRSLKTYGITFFLVKERIKGKNKLIPRLLGVTKDSVIRLDEKTKEVLKIWPLTSISRWAASLHAFTMDFGEYSPDDCYTAQTSEGEQISQLIAGYVDIITKKQKAKDHPGLIGDEESAMYEENVRAERATIVQHQRLPPPTHPKDIPVNGAAELPIVPQTEDIIQMGGSQVQRVNGWSQQHLATEATDLVDTNSVAMSGMPVQRQMSPDDFIIGGSHMVHYQQLAPIQRSFLHSINENVETLREAKERLYLQPSGERVLLGVGSDEASKRWLNESMGASQAKVTDEVGAMNAAVAQALRSANRVETFESGNVNQTAFGANTDPGDDLMMMQQSFRVVTIHFPAFVDDVKRVAVLRREAGAIRADQEQQAVVAQHAEESSQNLLTAARYVADAFTNLLESSKPLATGKQHDEEVNQTHISQEQIIPTSTAVSSSSRKAIIEAAGRVGEASNDLLRHVMHETGDEEYDATVVVLTEDERLYKDQLLTLAKAVANATAGLVVKAKNLATQSSLDPDSQQRVIGAATQTGLCTSQLVACTKVLAPTIHQPTCQEQLAEAAREVAWAVDGVVQASRSAVLSSGDRSVHEAIGETEAAATEVRDALDQLNAHLLKGSAKAYTGDALDNFQLAYDNLIQQHTYDGQRMVASARRLAQATAQMIADIKAQAELSGDDPDRQNRLFAAAKQLVDATTTLIAAAKVCSSQPDNLDYQADLRDAAENLNAIAYSAAVTELQQVRLIRNLQIAARAAVTGATQMVNVSEAAAQRCRGNTYQVLNDSKIVNNLIPRTVATIQASRLNPEDPMTQMELITACERFVMPCEALLRSSRSIAPTVTDLTTQSALDSSSAQLATAAEILRTCLARLAPMSRQLQLEAALARLARLSDEVAVIENNYKQGTLVPIPDEKLDDCYNLLGSSVQDGSGATRELHAVIDGLAHFQPEVVSRPDICGAPASMLASAIASLVQATRGVLAYEEKRDQSNQLLPAAESTRLNLIQDTRQAVQLAYELVKAAGDSRRACDSGQSAALATVLSHSEQLTSQLLDTLSRCLRGLPGHREISEATHLIEQRRDNLMKLSHSPSTRTVRWVKPADYERFQTDLTRAAVEFNQATGDLLSSYSPGSFRRTTERFAGAYEELTDRGVDLSTSAVVPANGTPRDQEPEVNLDLVHGLIDVSDHSHSLMTEAGRVCARPEEQNLRGRFQAAARDLTESISQLLTVCTTGVTQEQRECEIAIRHLEALRPLLENPNRPINNHHYSESVDAVAKSLSPLADSLRSMSNAVKDGNNVEFGNAVRQFADSMCELVEESAQAAYLIGVGDASSEPGRLTSVNAQLLYRSQKEVQQVCDAICNPAITDNQVLALSTEMARSAKVLCEACSAVSAQTPNPEARQQLNTLTRDTMQSITEMIQHCGDLTSRTESGSNVEVAQRTRQVTLANARTVSANVARLVQLITQSHQFTGQAARLTGESKEAQQPVCNSGLSCVNSAQAVLRAAQAMSANAKAGPSDSIFHNFANASRELSENIKALAAAMKEHAPGQRECQVVLEHIARLLQDLHKAKMASMEDRLQPQRELNEEGFQKQLATSVRALLEAAPALGRAARSEAEKLGHAVRSLDSYLPGITSSAIASASRSQLPSTQLIYLEHTCAVLEACEQLVIVARDCGGNPRAVHLHTNLDECVRGVRDSCEDLLNALDDLASRQGYVSTLIDTINRAMVQTEQIIQVPVDAKFSDYQAHLLRIARHMEQLNQAIRLRGRQPSEAELTPLAHTLAQEYQEMCETCKCATATLPDVRQADDLRNAVKAVGLATANLAQVTAGGRLRDAESSGRQTSLGSNRTIAELDRCSDHLDVKLRELIALLDIQGPYTQACLQSASTVSGIIADLDTTILFASSGTLHPPIYDDVDALVGTTDSMAYSRPPYPLAGAGEATADRVGRADWEYGNEGFGPVRDSITRTARALMDDTQSLVSSGAGEDQARGLANTAHVAVERVTQLADVVKRGAAVIGPGQPDTQVDLLSSCRDVATGLRNVFLAASQTPGRSSSDRVHTEVRTNAQLTLSSIEALLQKVKAIETDDRRGTQALTLAAKFCRAQAAQLDTPVDAKANALTPSSSRKFAPSASKLSSSSTLLARYLAPDDLARAATGPVQSVVSKAILAANSHAHNDVLNVASVTRDVAADLVTATKALVAYSDAPSETRNACASASRTLVVEFANLLDAIKANLLPASSAEESARLTASARRIADLSCTLLGHLDSLREGPRLVMYFRASSPEWRDVAEKFIGRHVAYHHHYVPNYAIAGPGSSFAPYNRPACYPLPPSATGQDDGEHKEDEAEARIQGAIDKIEFILKQHQPAKEGTILLRASRLVALATRDLIVTARSIGLAPPRDPADRVHRAPPSASLWRTELTVALTTEDMCQLATLCSEQVDQESKVDLFGTSIRLIPSKERLLAAVRRVAAASAQLLLSAKSRRLLYVTADVQKLQVVGQAVKQATDQLSSVLHQGQFSCDSAGFYVTVPSSPTSQGALDAQAQIRSQQSELEALEQHLANLRREQQQTQQPTASSRKTERRTDLV